MVLPQCSPAITLLCHDFALERYQVNGRQTDSVRRLSSVAPMRECQVFCDPKTRLQMGEIEQTEGMCLKFISSAVSYLVKVGYS